MHNKLAIQRIPPEYLQIWGSQKRQFCRCSSIISPPVRSCMKKSQAITALPNQVLTHLLVRTSSGTPRSLEAFGRCALSFFEEGAHLQVFLPSIFAKLNCCHVALM